jgi:NADPH:quinone reductase-like Zn-dependent oxidoreductase
MQCSHCCSSIAALLDDWPAQLQALLAKTDRPDLDSVIDGGGSDILTKVSRFLKPGGKVVCFGMTGGLKITMTMREVLKNQQLIGTASKSQTSARNDLIPHSRLQARRWDR